jgi:hypothetical protein
MNTNIFQKLLSKEMTRKEFLLHLGMLVLVITGVAGMLKTLSDPYVSSKQKTTQGFGAGPYGGVNKG